MHLISVFAWRRVIDSSSGPAPAGMNLGPVGDPVTEFMGPSSVIVCPAASRSFHRADTMNAAPRAPVTIALTLSAVNLRGTDDVASLVIPPGTDLLVLQLELDRAAPRFEPGTLDDSSLRMPVAAPAHRSQLIRRYRCSIENGKRFRMSKAINGPRRPKRRRLPAPPRN
jgi:hypothetical protein